MTGQKHGRIAGILRPVPHALLTQTPGPLSSLCLAIAASLLSSLAGCGFVPPPPPVEMYAQKIDVGQPRGSVSAHAEFPHRTDVLRGKADVIPAVIRRTMPELPQTIGPVDVEILFVLVVETDGSVREVKLLRSSGRPELDELYANALRSWQFTPGKSGGRSVAQAAHQLFRVKLD